MGAVSFCRMGNVLRREKREQVIALGRLGWSLRRTEEATGVRRETVGEYLRRAGVAIRPVGSWGEKSLSKAATQVTTGFSAERTASRHSASASEPYREWIAEGPGPKRHRHLAGSGGRSRVRGRLPKR